MQDIHPAQGAAADALPEWLRVDPGLHSQGQALGDGLPHAVADHVVHQLGDGAGADLAGVEHLVAEGVQQWLDAVEDLTLAADHHGQVAGLGAALASADRGVHHMNALGPELDRKFTDQGGAAGGQVDVDRAGLDSFENALCPGGHQLHFAGSGQGGQRDIAAFRHIGGRAAQPGARFQEGTGRLLPQIKNHHGVAGLLDVPGHAAAHIAESDKSYSLHSSPLRPRCRC